MEASVSIVCDDDRDFGSQSLIKTSKTSTFQPRWSAMCTHATSHYKTQYSLRRDSSQAYTPERHAAYSAAIKPKSLRSLLDLHHRRSILRASKVDRTKCHGARVCSVVWEILARWFSRHLACPLWRARMPRQLARISCSGRWAHWLHAHVPFWDRKSERRKTSAVSYFLLDLLETNKSGNLLFDLLAHCCCPCCAATQVMLWVSRTYSKC